MKLEIKTMETEFFEWVVCVDNEEYKGVTKLDMPSDHFLWVIGNHLTMLGKQFREKYEKKRIE